jgi:arylamine N-acetyltransferase
MLQGGWRFRHDPTGSFVGMDFEPASAAPSAFELAHLELSTSPTSSFVRNFTVQRRDGTGVDKLVGCTLSRIEGTRTVEWQLRNAVEFFAALADVFGLTLDDVEPDAREVLWQRSLAAHENWTKTRANAS